MISLKSLEGLSGVRHAFFTRQGGASKGVYASLNCGPGSGDASANVKANRTRAMAAMGLAGVDLLTANQVHSATVVTVDGPWRESGAPKADGLATKVRGLALGVLTADCAPVLFADAKAGIVGAVHAGWRGAKAGVLEATVKAMIDLGADVEDVSAGIGPCIAQESYEVESGFAAAFMDDDRENRDYLAAAEREGHYLFDLPGYVAGRLKALGVASVETAALDTFADEKLFFSYRRATLKGEGDYGRNLSVVALVGKT